MECLSDFLMVNRNHWGITAITPRLRVFPEYRPGGDMNSGILPHTNMYLPGESGLRYYCSPRSIVWIDHPHHQDRSIGDRKSTRLNSSHSQISYAVFCLKKK